MIQLCASSDLARVRSGEHNTLTGAEVAAHQTGMYSIYTGLEGGYKLLVSILWLSNFVRN